MAKAEDNEQPDAGGAQVAAVVGGWGNLVVEVNEDHTASHEGEQYGPGDTFEVEGLTAVALAQAGAVKIVGTPE